MSRLGTHPTSSIIGQCLFTKFEKPPARIGTGRLPRAHSCSKARVYVPHSYNCRSRVCRSDAPITDLTPQLLKRRQDMHLPRSCHYPWDLDPGPVLGSVPWFRLCNMRGEVEVPYSAGVR